MTNFALINGGRIKIRNAIRKHQVAERFLSQTLSQFDEAEYFEVLMKLALKKWNMLSKKR